MAVPKKKTSQSRKNMRRSHDALSVNAVSVCKNCGEIVKPHNVCKACGSYNGKQIIENSAK
ncbi:50S ribosomal protein L32 [bacterium]|nr:50S ribosomal protein L32 [bacterium]